MNNLEIINDRYVLDEIKTIEECQRALDIEYKRKEYFESKGIVLVEENKEFELTSLEVVDIINKFREEEGSRTKLQHKNFIASIRMEVETLENAGIEGGLNFKPTSYKDSWNRDKICYKMNKAGAMQMLNKESAIVRYKTQLYIEALERKNRELSNTPSCMIEDVRARLKAYERELDQWEYNDCLKNIKILEEKKNNLTLSPKADVFDRFMSSKGLYSSSQVAKLLKLSSARKLNKILNEDLHLIYKQGKNWLTYSTTDVSWFKIVVGETNGHNFSSLKITPKGVIEISKLLEVDIEEKELEDLI